MSKIDGLKGKTQEELNRIIAQGKAAEDIVNKELDRVVFQINNFKITVTRKQVRIAVGIVILIGLVVLKILAVI